MKLIFHIIKKDFRHLWPLLAAWWALLVVQALLPLWVFDAVAGAQISYGPVPTFMGSELLSLQINHRLVDLLGGSGKYLFIANALLVAIIASNLMAADLPGRDRAHWRALPISRLGLLEAKALFLLFFIGLSVVVAGAAAKIGYGLPMRDWLSGSATAMQYNLLWAVAAITAMVLFENVTLRVLFFLGLFALCLIIVLGIPFHLEPYMESRILLSVRLLLVIGAAIGALRYLGVPRLASIVIFALSLAGAWVRVEGEFSGPGADSQRASWRDDDFSNLSLSVLEWKIQREQLPPLRQAGFIPNTTTGPDTLRITLGRRGGGSIRANTREAWAPDTGEPWLRENAGKDIPIVHSTILGEFSSQPAFIPPGDVVIVSKIIPLREPMRGFSAQYRYIFARFGIAPFPSDYPLNFPVVAKAAGLGRLLDENYDSANPAAMTLGIFARAQGMPEDSLPRKFIATFDYETGSLERVADIPLTPGARDGRGVFWTRFVDCNFTPVRSAFWSDFAKEKAGPPQNIVNIIYVVSHAALSNWPGLGWTQEPWQCCVLWNPKREECFLLRVSRPLVAQQTFAYDTVSSTQLYMATAQFQYYENGKLRVFTPAEVQAWVADARLVRLVFTPKENYRSTITIDPFVPPAQDAATPSPPAP